MQLPYLIYFARVSQVPFSPTYWHPPHWPPFYKPTTGDESYTMDSSLAKPSDFTVHIFVNHGPFIASIILPDLFSDFPDSVWKLPQLIATPPRPAELPQPVSSQMSQSLLQELYADPRKGLGRYVLSDPLPSSTTLRELSEMLEQEFGMSTNLLAHFTIFPQWPWDGDIEPEWNDRPLPWNLTLGEAALLDAFAVAADQYVEISDQYAPVLHLVVETKAAALKRIVGGGFLANALGKEYKYRRDMWNRLECFTNTYPPTLQPQIVQELLRWRGVYYSLEYLESERAKLATQQPLDETSLRDLASEIEKLQNRKLEAKVAISTLASQWENWVLKRNYGDKKDFEDLQDDEVEGKVRSILQQRGIVKEWGKSDKGESLVEMLLKPAVNSRTGLKIREELQLERHRVRSEHSEGPWEIISKNETPEQSYNQAHPDSNPVEAISFRREDGTLDPALSTFSIKSGILSWGQMLPMYYGLLQQNLTNNAAHIADKLSGGTIIQNVYTYRSAARNGEWKVRRYYSTSRADDYYDPDGQEMQAGWVVCHNNFDAMEVVKRVRAIRGTGPGAVSNRNEHVDKDVLYIGRYDWSYHWHHATDRDFEAKFNDWAGFSAESEEALILTTEQQVIREKQKTIMDLRQKLQDGLLLFGHPPKEDDVPAMVDYISQLEQHADLEALIIHQTKIHKVLKAILKIGDIPREDEFNIRRRLVVLLEKWTDILSTEPELTAAGVPAIETGSHIDQPVLRVKKSGYFIAMDALEFDPDFAQAYKRNCDGDHKIPVGVIFRKGGTKFGAFVDITRVEYEFGWLVFSGKRHEEHDADELIAIVYDGRYEVLQGLYHKVEAGPEALAA